METVHPDPVKFSHEKPPVFERCQKEFGANWESVVITYGDTIHSKRPISPDLIAHESVHVKQQLDMGVEAWWEKYFTDKIFRLHQELEAYHDQLFYAKEHYNRHSRKRLEHHICHSLANNYGGLCNKEMAKYLVESILLSIKV